MEAPPPQGGPTSICSEPGLSKQLPSYPQAIAMRRQQSDSHFKLVQLALFFKRQKNVFIQKMVFFLSATCIIKRFLWAFVLPFSSCPCLKSDASLLLRGSRGQGVHFSVFHALFPKCPFKMFRAITRG